MKDIELNELQPKEITEEEIIFSNNPNCEEGLILVYANWCRHCDDFKPMYHYLMNLFNKLEKQGTYTTQNNKIITKINDIPMPKLWAMDIDKHKNKTEGHNLSFVQGFPTILIVKNINDKKGKIEIFEGKERNIPNLLKIFETTLGMKN